MNTNAAPFTVAFPLPGLTRLAGCVPVLPLAVSTSPHTSAFPHIKYVPRPLDTTTRTTKMPFIFPHHRAARCVIMTADGAHHRHFPATNPQALISLAAANLVRIRYERELGTVGAALGSSAHTH